MMFPDTIRKELMFDLSFALSHRCAGLKWRREDPGVALAAEALVAHLERANYLVVRGPMVRTAPTPGPSLDFLKARQELRHRYLQRIESDLSEGLDPEAARAYGERFVADLRREPLFRPLSEADFKQELVDFGGMLLQLSHYKARTNAPAAHALENIWHVLYHHKKKEAPL